MKRMEKWWSKVGVQENRKKFWYDGKDGGGEKSSRLLWEKLKKRLDERGRKNGVVKRKSITSIKPIMIILANYIINTARIVQLVD